MNRGNVRLFLRASLTVVLIATGAPAGIGAAVFRPAPDSPLATDNRDFYAVAQDRQTLLVARAPRHEWMPLAKLPNARIRGLTWAFGRLYFSDEADASIQFVPTGGAKTPQLVHRGLPLVRPGELAFAGASLVVADAKAGELFRVRQQPGATTPDLPTAIRIPLRITEGMFITGWPAGEILISDADSGLLAQVTNVGGTPRFRRLQQRGESGASVPWYQRPEQPDSVRRSGYPGVNYPGAIDVHNGILYVVDVRSRLLFAAGIHDTRAIRLPMAGSVPMVTRLAANPVSLTALDAENGRLVTWPRVVPSEVTLLPGARMQSLFPVIEYLHRRKLLSTRRVPVKGTLKETLAAARMTWPERGTPAEPVTAEGYFASFCLLNPELCEKGVPKGDPAPGSTIVLADLYAERFTSAAQVKLDGTQTLGDVADAAITSDEFKTFKGEEHLRDMNGHETTDGRPIREAKTGRFRISQEEVRYVIPIEAAELRSGTEFRQLEARVQRTLRIDPLERVPTTAASSDPLNHPNDASCVKAREALAALMATIGFVPAVPKRTVYVGVAESGFDLHHRDFVDPATKTRVLHVFDNNPELQAADAIPVSEASDPPGVEPVQWRPFTKEDHGTAVASLIAGRTRAYGDEPGFTRAMVGMFTNSGDATALGQDLERAMTRRLMPVVNLSLASVSDASKLRTVIETSVRDTLYVVAAPNTNSQLTLCAGTDLWYPACHGRTFRNVLVVGGTTLDGQRIHPKSPVGNDVHIFAPEEGYFSAGRSNSYVSVSGTSFATALVSAAAAMLSAAGMKSPAEIRHRLITTATVMEIPNRPQWARLLNVKRALSHLEHAVIVDAAGKEHPARVVNASDTLVFKTVKGNRTIAVTVGDVKRLARVRGTAPVFDLAYVVPGPDDPDGEPTEKLGPLVAVKPDNAPWKVCYEPLGADGLSTGAPETCVDLQEKSDYVAPVR